MSNKYEVTLYSENVEKLRYEYLEGQYFDKFSEAREYIKNRYKNRTNGDKSIYYIVSVKRYVKAKSTMVETIYKYGADNVFHKWC